MILCQTNFMRDIRSCTIKGHHEPTCDGWAYQWSDDAETELSTGHECAGCEPRPAHVGFVCRSCHEMILAGLSAYPQWSRALQGVERAQTPERSTGTPLGYDPLGPLRRDIEAILSHHRSYGGHLETWVSSAAGAEDAIRFGIEMRGAVKRHPIRDEPRQLNRTYCTSCRLLTLVWHPPAFPGGDVIVKCVNPKCGHVVNPAAHDDIAYIEASARRRKR